MKKENFDLAGLDELKDDPTGIHIDGIFKEALADKKNSEEKTMGQPDDDFELASMEEIDLALDSEGKADEAPPIDEGFELSFSDSEDLDLGDAEPQEADSDEDQYGDLSLSEDSEDDFVLEDSPEDTPLEDLGELSFDEIPDETPGDELTLADDDPLGDDLSLENLAEESVSLDDAEALSFTDASPDLSDDAKEKLKEIDAILVQDASQIMNRDDFESKEDNLDEPLVSEDLDLGKLGFSEPVAEEPVTKRKKKEPEIRVRGLGQDLEEISGAYSGEMERMQATISNLRADREELLSKIQKFEEEKLLQGRQSLTLRAELDERKIELTIIRKKLNEEIGDLKDRLKIFEEKKLILEEKNRLLTQELDKAAQKNKIDVKKVQLRERELEQKLELLKSDAETQIRHRDLKILELKRKIDSMEFDMESITVQEKRSVESRFELEDKLEKAIKTLRSAITVLEDESDHSNALDALKKNIDM